MQDDLSWVEIWLPQLTAAVVTGLAAGFAAWLAVRWTANKDQKNAYELHAREHAESVMQAGARFLDDLLAETADADASLERVALAATRWIYTLRGSAAIIGRVNSRLEEDIELHVRRVSEQLADLGPEERQQSTDALSATARHEATAMLLVVRSLQDSLRAWLRDRPERVKPTCGQA